MDIAGQNAYEDEINGLSQSDELEYDEMVESGRHWPELDENFDFSKI